MKKAIRMPSIEQFRSTIHHITKKAQFNGLNEDNEPIYNSNSLPSLKAKGTVKLHGTNDSVCFNKEHGMWVQSKKNIIEVGKDNAGFAFFVENNKNDFWGLIENVLDFYILNPEKETITIYGEWAGKGIQSGVGISQLEKTFYIFGIKITPHTEDIDAYWLPSKNVFSTDNKNIFEINEFKTFELYIDFNNPLLSNNKMIEMLQEVENECPVAKHFGISGIGEGIVFEVNYKGNIYRWKMKGEKHAGKSKIKKANKVDDVKLQLIIDVVEKVTPEWRLSQMYQETFNTLNGGKGDIKKTGDYLRAVINDITKEESVIITEAGLIPKDINASISKKARTWFMQKLNEEVGI